MSIPQHIHRLKTGGGVCADSIDHDQDEMNETSCTVRWAAGETMCHQTIEVPRLACIVHIEIAQQLGHKAAA